MSTTELPPWGGMDEDNLGDVSDRPVPYDWRRADGSAAARGEWEAWRDAIVNDLAALLWPKWDSVSSAWVGGAIASVAALNDADFALLLLVPGRANDPVAGRPGSTPTHIEFFQEEDQQAWGARYDRYDPCSGAFKASLPDLLLDGIRTKVGSLHLQLKQVFQRPRPYQVALIQRRIEFRHRYATSASSPSLVSGHCLQGVIAGCNAYAELRSSLRPASVELLKQFTVDIGDRRVFTGVHYPSDNISSWYVAMKLIPHVFDPGTVPVVAKFLWETITFNSAVFKAVDAYVPRSGASPYKKSLDALRAVARSMGLVDLRADVGSSPRAFRGRIG